MSIATTWQHWVSAQGWNLTSQVSILLGFIEARGLKGDLDAYAGSAAELENGSSGQVENGESSVEPLLLNTYQCPQCGQTWNDTWSCAADDDCPHCGTRHVSPIDSEESVG